jgi:hypothetical protein
MTRISGWLNHFSFPPTRSLALRKVKTPFNMLDLGSRREQRQYFPPKRWWIFAELHPRKQYSSSFSIFVALTAPLRCVAYDKEAHLRTPSFYRPAMEDHLSLPTFSSSFHWFCSAIAFFFAAVNAFRHLGNEYSCHRDSLSRYNVVTDPVTRFACAWCFSYLLLGTYILREPKFYICST